MGNNLFVTGFPYETTQEELGKLFADCGTVLNAKVLMDRETGRSRGIGFVVMSTDAEAQAAIAKLNGSTVGHRKIFVNEARPAEADKPAYTGPERRSGNDRRQSPPAAGERRPWAKKPWDKDKKPGFGGKKPWEKKPWDKDRKPAFGEKKPWEKKPWDKDRKPGLGEKKLWDKKKPWERMYSSGDKPKSAEPLPRRKKKWGPGGPNTGRKPGDFKRKPGGFKRKPGGFFRG
jgi:hypothetical protein